MLLSLTIYNWGIHIYILRASFDVSNDTNINSGQNKFFSKNKDIVLKKFIKVKLILFL